MDGCPSVALIVVNRDGAAHLPACLDSVAALEYEHDRLDTIVVDNGSSDGSLRLLAERYPWVRVLAQERNLGFAEAVNVGARAASGDCVAFANNDMRLDPAWLRELLRLYEPAAGCVCVGGVILDWTGERIDFADAFVNFHGIGGQGHFGKPVSEVAVDNGRELPFACGGSMLIERRLFLELGGFDPSFFAFFEDVDLGWRLWLSGYRVRLAAEARSFHRHHGTASSLTEYQRLFLYERNALRTLVKNLDEANLGRVLAPASLLLTERAVLASGSERAAFEPGAAVDRTGDQVPREALAPLHAVADVLDDLQSLLAARAQVQGRRGRSDEEIFATFGRPFLAVGGEDEYLEAAATLRRLFRLDTLFAERRATKLLVLGNGRRERTAELAAAAARFLTVVYASERSGRAPRDVERVRLRDAHQLEGLLAEADAVLVEAGATLPASVHGRVIVDLADAHPGEDVPPDADLYLCTSEPERQRWLAALVSTGNGGAPVEVVPTGDANDPVRPMRRLLEQPRASGASAEDVQVLLSRWRTEYGVGKPLWWHLGRALWRGLPARARDRLRPLLRRG